MELMLIGACRPRGREGRQCQGTAAKDGEAFDAKYDEASAGRDVEPSVAKGEGACGRPCPGRNKVFLGECCTVGQGRPQRHADPQGKLVGLGGGDEDQGSLSAGRGLGVLGCEGKDSLGILGGKNWGRIAGASAYLR